MGGGEGSAVNFFTALDRTRTKFLAVKVLPNGKGGGHEWY